MTLMSLDEYEEIKGKVADKGTAFEKGRIVAFAYMADCIGSPVFSGMEFIVRKIERERAKGRICTCEKEESDNED